MNATAARSLTGARRSPDREEVPVKVVVLDDDADITFLLDVLLRKNGYEVTAWSSRFAAMAEPDVWAEADVVVVDYDLRQGMTGVDVVRWAKDEAGFDGKTLVITGSPRAWDQRDTYLVEETVDSVLGKVFDLDDLLAELQRLVGG